MMIKLETIGDFNKAWVAEIPTTDELFYTKAFKRIFLKGVRDYTNANGANTRGIFTIFELEEGKIYEINEPISWKRTDRYFVKIVNNEIEKI